jgi:hypothetical protein
MFLFNEWKIIMFTIIYSIRKMKALAHYRKQIKKGKGILSLIERKRHTIPYHIQKSAD